MKLVVEIKKTKQKNLPPSAQHDETRGQSSLQSHTDGLQCQFDSLLVAHLRFRNKSPA